MSALLNVCPTSSMDDRQDDLLGHIKSRCQFQRASVTFGVQSTNSFHILLIQLCARIVHTLMGLRVVSMVLPNTRITALRNFRFEMKASPTLSTTCSPRHGVLPIVLSTNLISTTATFILAVLYVVILCATKEMFGTNACWIVATVATAFLGLLSVFQEPGDTVGEESDHFAVDAEPEATIAAAYLSALPLPTFSGWPKSGSLAHFRPKPRDSLSRERWDNHVFLLQTIDAPLYQYLWGCVNV